MRMLAPKEAIEMEGIRGEMVARMLLTLLLELLLVLQPDPQLLALELAL